MQHRFSEEPTPEDTLLVARIKIATSWDTGSAATEELSYLRSQYKDDELSPSQQVQTRMIELWERGNAAKEWNDLLERSTEILEVDERLELLLAHARAACREGRKDDMLKSSGMASQLVDADSVWTRHFRQLTED